MRNVLRMIAFGALVVMLSYVSQAEPPCDPSGAKRAISKVCSGDTPNKCGVEYSRVLEDEQDFLIPRYTTSCKSIYATVSVSTDNFGCGQMPVNPAVPVFLSTTCEDAYFRYIPIKALCVTRQECVLKNHYTEIPSPGLDGGTLFSFYSHSTCDAGLTYEEEVTVKVTVPCVHPAIEYYPGDGDW